MYTICVQLAWTGSLDALETQVVLRIQLAVLGLFFLSRLGQGFRKLSEISLTSEKITGEKFYLCKFGPDIRHFVFKRNSPSSITVNFNVRK